MTQNPIASCPAPVTSPTAASATDPHTLIAQLGAGAPVAMTPAPATPGSPAEPPAKALRPVAVECRCEQYLRGEPAPSEPLALVRMAKTEADAVEHLHRATCHAYALWARVEEVAGQMARGLHVPDAESIGAALNMAYDRQREIERMTAQRWGVSLGIHHAI